jgi:hypothetical protein
LAEAQAGCVSRRAGPITFRRFTAESSALLFCRFKP